MQATAEMEDALLHSSATRRLAERLRGRLVRPEDAGYDDVRRVWNGRVDRRPAVVVLCAGTADVIAAVDFARDTGLAVTIRGGGRGLTSPSVGDDDLVIDLSGLREVRVDPASRTVRAAGGATWGGVDHETQAFGLAVTGAVDSRAGVVGHGLGGGIGFLGPWCGLTADNLASANVVLADGRTVTASDRDHPDLFWALRGGGGGLGVVTSLELGLRELGPEVMTARVYHPLGAATRALAFFREFVASAPDEVCCIAAFVNLPPVDPRAEEPAAVALSLAACHAGSLDDGAAALEPLRSFGDPLLAVLAPMPYVALQSSFGGRAPADARYDWTACMLDALSDDVIAAVVQHVDRLPGPYSAVLLEPLGGAIARVDPATTAYPHRAACFRLGILTGWTAPSDDDRILAWSEALLEAVTPVAGAATAAGGVDDPAISRSERLREVRRLYDPGGLFTVGSSAVTTA